MNNRRKFIFYSGLLGVSSFLPGSLVDFFSLDSKKTLFLVIYETYFPKNLSKSKYEELKSSYINQSSFKKVLDSFYDTKKILKDRSFYNPSYSKWLVLFDSKASYYRFSYTVVSGRYFDELKFLKQGFQSENYGYRVPLQLSHKPLKALFSDLKNHKLEKLHQTKSLDDLNAFQKRLV